MTKFAFPLFVSAAVSGFPLMALAQAPAAPAAPTGPLFELRLHLDAATQPQLFAQARQALAQNAVEAGETKLGDKIDFVLTGLSLNPSGEAQWAAELSGLDLDDQWVAKAVEKGGEVVDVNGRQAVLSNKNGQEVIVSESADGKLQSASSPELLANLATVVGSGQAPQPQGTEVLSAWVNLAGARAAGAETPQVEFVDNSHLSLDFANQGAQLVIASTVNDADAAAQAESSLRNLLYMAQQGAASDPEAAQYLGLLGQLGIEREGNQFTVRMDWSPQQVSSLWQLIEAKANEAKGGAGGLPQAEEASAPAALENSAQVPASSF